MTVDAVGEKPHDDGLEEEVACGNVEEAEEEEHAGAEVEGKHRVPRHDALRLLMELFADVFGHVACAAVLLAQQFHEFLELRRGLLLLARVVDVCLEEVFPEAVALAGCLVIGLLLLLGVVQFAALRAFEHEEMYLDVVVGQSLLTAHSGEARVESQDDDHGCGDGDVLLCVGDAQPTELETVVLVEAEHQADVDGDEPCEASHAVEDAPQAALLARQSRQLSVRTVEYVCPAEQKDADKIEPKSLPALVVEAAMHEEVGRGSTDEHGENRDGVGMNVKLGEEQRTKITEWTHDSIVEPILCLRGLKRR